MRGASATDIESPQWQVDLGGFVHADYALFVFDHGGVASSFRPKQLELGVAAQWGEQAGVRVDLNAFGNWVVDSAYQNQSAGALADSLVERAFVAWTPGRFTLRAGKMGVAAGVEALDVTERIPLSRSFTSEVATPDLFTGALGAVEVLPQLDLTLQVSNGWDKAVDDNRAKTALVALPHRWGELETGDWLFEGTLAGMAGAERSFSADARVLLDYSAAIRPLRQLLVNLELLYGWEEGVGRDAAGNSSGQLPAYWYGGQLDVYYDGSVQGAAVQGLRVGGRVEYHYDPDLSVGHPRLGNLPQLTTLLSTTAVARYALLPGLEAGIEYSIDFQKGEVANVSLHRNAPVSQLGSWFQTHQLLLALVGAF